MKIANQQIATVTDDQNIDQNLVLPVPRNDNSAPYLVATVGDKTLLVYLVRDDDCENPLDSMNGEGEVVLWSQGKRDAEARQKIQDAFALNSNGEPEIDRLWSQAAEKLAQENHGCSYDELKLSIDEQAAFAREAEGWAMRWWKECRTLTGTLGDCDAVLLSRCDDGTLRPTNRLETDNPSINEHYAAWIPDDCAREEIVRRMSAYAIGEIKREAGGYRIVMDQQFGNHLNAVYPEWHQAFEILQNQYEALLRPLSDFNKQQQLALGRRRARDEMAVSSVELYNNWASGDNWAVVEASYPRREGVQYPESHEVLWNVVGAESAEQVMRERLNAMKQNLSRQERAAKP